MKPSPTWNDYSKGIDEMNYEFTYLNRENLIRIKKGMFSIVLKDTASVGPKMAEFLRELTVQANKAVEQDIKADEENSANILRRMLEEREEF